MATAEEQHYKVNQSAKSNPHPYLGYRYRILHSQGPNANGGARDYMVGNYMFDGFAVVAYPAEYGNSGIMTFIVNQDGIVYQQNLGTSTAKIAESMTAFDPDSNWQELDPEKTMTFRKVSVRFQVHPLTQRLGHAVKLAG